MQGGRMLPEKAGEAKRDQSLDANVRMQNEFNSMRQIQRLQQRYDQPAEKRKGAAAGGFR